MKTNHASVVTLCGTLFIALVLHAPTSWAANGNPPEYMTYQGFLTDGNGEPLGNTNTGPKNYDVIFRIWTDQNTGTRLWSEQQTLTVDKGYFSVLLGEGAQYQSEPHPALSTLFTNTLNASDRYVEVTVKGIGAGNTDVTILPRLRLLTSPYAFLARNAVNAGNLVNSANGQVVSITGTNVGINRTSPTSALDVNGTVKATTFSGSGSSITSLNANNLSSGTVPDARLSANVAKLNASPQFFTGYNVFGDNIQLGTSSSDYQHLRVGGGNSSGFLYGAYNPLGDGIHLGYNFYYDAAGTSHCIQTNGSTSRLTVGYGGIALATGGHNTAPAARMFVNADGNVGIGTTTPVYPLNFANSLGDKISLYGNAGNHYGFGVQSATLQIHADSNTSKIVFGYGQSTNLTETMRIQGNGNVGIGTTTPAGKLDVNGTIRVAGEAPIQIKRYTLSDVPAADGNTMSLLTTEYPTNAWSAAVVGWTLFANVAEGSQGPYIVKAIKGTYGLSPTTNWGIQVVWYHHIADLVGITADVMFIRKELVSDMR